MIDTIAKEPAPAGRGLGLRRLLRPSLRKLLILILALGACFGAVREVQARRERFKSLYHHHYFKAGMGTSVILMVPKDEPKPSPLTPKQHEYHRKLSMKYEFAADHPWLPVMPDPPFDDRE